eukprot:scaffold82706_cov45-Attheya_sp.AAC.1
MGRSKRNSRKKNSDGSFTGTTDGNVDQIGPPASEVNSLPCIRNKLKPRPKELDYRQRLRCKVCRREYDNHTSCMDVYARWDPHKFVCGCCKVSKCFCGKQHLGNEKGCVRTICQAYGVDETDPHWSYVLPQCIPINSVASKHKLSDYFYWECWNCDPNKFVTIRQKKSRLRPSIPPPVVPNSANEPNNDKKDPPANEPNNKKDPPSPPESEKNKMKESTPTVPKSADEPDKQEDPPPPPESEKNKMKESTAIVPKKDP